LRRVAAQRLNVVWLEALRAACSCRLRAVCSRWIDEVQLLEDGPPVVEAELLGDETVLHVQDRDPREPHGVAAAGRSSPIGVSSKGLPVWVPPPIHRPTT
jgi:hypothetical protein